jgi:hypothetical protein
MAPTKIAYVYIHRTIKENEKVGWNFIRMETIRNLSAVLFDVPGIVPDRFETNKYTFSKIDSNTYAYKPKKR